jgi:hypothetical protein
MAQYNNGEIAPNFSSISKYSPNPSYLDRISETYTGAPSWNTSIGEAFNGSSVLGDATDNSGGSIFGGLSKVFGGDGSPMKLDWLNKDTMSTLSGLAQGAGSLWSAYNAAKQFGLAKDQFKFSKNAFNANFANQAKMINSQLEDRQRARIGGTGDNNAAGNYESLGTYMAKNKVNGAAV